MVFYGTIQYSQELSQPERDFGLIIFATFLALMPMPPPLLKEIRCPRHRVSLWIHLKYSMPQIIKSFNTSKENQSSFFRQYSVDLLNELWPLNHKAVWLRRAHIVEYAERLSNTGKVFILLSVPLGYLAPLTHAFIMFLMQEEKAFTF